MQQIKQLLAISLFMGLAQITQAQDLSNLRSKCVLPKDTIVLDSLSIEPSTFQIVTDGVKKGHYRLDAARATLYWQDPIPKDSICIIYRVFPFSLYKPYARKTYDQSEKFYPKYGQQLYELSGRKNDIIDFGSLNSSGNFSRAVTVGNQQDLVVNSSFNLQLSGKINDDVEILAAITDNNIPFQSAGNTQKLQEFDRVFIQLTRGANHLIVGDYAIQESEFHFFQIQRKLQGASLNLKNILGRERTQTSFNAAVSRGKFSRNVFQGGEGNQGPYKLKGANNELFIIILSGSEQVFIDGQLMQRGTEYDYVIDYNLGEITFTTNRMITKDSRIAVEFEYSDKNYLRSLFHFSSDYTSDKLSLRLQAFSEQDAKNQPILQELTDNQISHLRTIGDNLQNAGVPGFVPVEFEPNKLLYALDTLSICGKMDTVFTLSTDSTKQLYQVSFTNVGDGLGNYIISSNNINGRVYEYIAPDSISCVRQGSFSPIIELITPIRQQLVVVAGTYKLNNSNTIQAELALSNKDLNTFSDIDDQNNAGLASKLNWTTQYNLGPKWKMETGLGYEWEQACFDPIEPLRQVEFQRDWNISNLDDADKHFFESAVGFRHSDLLRTDYSLTHFRFGGDYEAWKHSFATRLKWKDITLNSSSSHLVTSEPERNSRFFRPQLELSKKVFKNWSIGTIYQGEKNKIREPDSLALGSLAFDRYELYLKKLSDDDPLWFSLSRRDDFSPFEGRLALLTRAYDVSFEGTILKHPKNNLSLKFTYRQLEVTDTLRTSLRDDRNGLGELDYSFILLDGFVRSTIAYEVGSGQQQQFQDIYQFVGNGLGTHIAINTAEGDTIFQPAISGDIADYIVVRTPTGQFERTGDVGFNGTIQITPRALWQKNPSDMNFLSWFGWHSSLQIERKFKGPKTLWRYQPFQFSVSDDNTLSIRSFVRNSLTIEPVRSPVRAELFLVNNSVKTLLNSGTDGNQKNSGGGNFKWTVSSKSSAKLVAERGEVVFESTAFAGKNYQIHYFSMEPEVSFQFNTNLGLSLSYRFKNSENRLGEEGEKARNNQLKFSAKWRNLAQSSLEANLTYASVTFKNGSGENLQTGSSLAYTMLESLQPGTNFLWSIRYQRRIAKSVELGFHYNGRKAGTNAVRHVGRVQLSAIF